MIAAPARTLALVGFMGAGKSRTAPVLAARLGREAIDADEAVEAAGGAPVARIFAERGEAGFRELEERVVLDLLERRGAVVALGGGAVLSEAVRRGLRERCETVLLEVSPETAWRRVAGAGERPLAQDAEAFAALYGERRPLYRAVADLLVDADAADPAAAVPLVPLARPGARGRLAELAGGRPAALIADERVLALHPPPWEVEVTVPLPAGEAAKTVAVAAGAWQRLAEAAFERGGVVIGYGGGAATDLAGFVAATYRRGVPWLAVPTTLVGMVDAAIGGKTAVDLPGAKNEVGAFHLPERVVADPDVLATLPEREWAFGMAEVVKTALLAGGELWDLVRAGRAEDADRLELVRRCAAHKARVVAEDPREAGPRATLNLGHTIGHALEAAGGFARLAHGEAVAVGLLAALRLSERVAGLDPAVTRETAELLGACGLPRSAGGLDPAAVLAALRRDKKARAGAPRFVLLEAVGRARFGVPVPAPLVEEAVAAALAEPAPG